MVNSAESDVKKELKIAVTSLRGSAFVRDYKFPNWHTDKVQKAMETDEKLSYTEMNNNGDEILVKRFAYLWTYSSELSSWIANIAH